jgi:hypothetical protein
LIRQTAIDLGRFEACVAYVLRARSGGGDGESDGEEGEAQHRPFGRGLTRIDTREVRRVRSLQEVKIYG